jgi:hypothetical protein
LILEIIFVFNSEISVEIAIAIEILIFVNTKPCWLNRSKLIKKDEEFIEEVT